MQTAAKLHITIATVTDRGLSEKRPVNEDSLLADAERGIFAVADGVGGAQSGEIASQTAIETLSESFRRHTPEDDVEDLMELAIQRANAAIYGMSRKGGSRVSMMATTIVALHIGTDSVTFGHVGDSRIYRSTPEGVLSRETIDHSVVEEELRAGLITEEQAAAHPNRNIISRALGAEPAVEVDLHAHPLVEGTTYLLCSDGITRHIQDEELQTYLRDYDDLEEVCEELKRLCYQRGAEDNLTAVIIRIGARSSQTFTSSPAAQVPVFDDETTLSPRIRHDESSSHVEAETQSAPASPAQNASSNGERTVIPIPQPRDSSPVSPNTSPPVQKQSGIGGRFVKVVLTLLILSLVGFGGFYGWTLFQQYNVIPITTTPDAGRESVPSPLPVVSASYEQRRAAVDERPDDMWLRMDIDKRKDPMKESDPEFMYLYGRAWAHKGETEQAASTFAQVISLFKNQAATLNGGQPTPAGRALQAAENALQSNEPRGIQNAANLLDEYITLSRAGVTNQPNNQPDNQFNNQPDNPNASQTPPQ